MSSVDRAIRWGYAINQWKPQFDDFVRREQHERALKTISVAGFEGVELSAGTGRWEPLGNPQRRGHPDARAGRVERRDRGPETIGHRLGILQTGLP